MCGIAGIVARPRGAGIEKIGARMANSLARRGPDDSRVWTDAEAGVCLAHRRLSVIDLSPAGQQPMASSSGRYVLSFNGEIYNHLEIRAELEAAGVIVAWRGRSDTETLLEAIEHWGLEATLRLSSGMFAIALWDRDERRLALARDRFGEKPIYYGWAGGGRDRAFLFGSELKALRAYPGFVNEVNRDTLALFLQHCVVPAPYSIYDNVFKLLPGYTLMLEADGVARQRVEIEAYWSVTDVVLQGLAAPICGEAEAVTALDDTLRKAVSRQCVSDVPLGAFLSGGVDSSTVVALMQAQSSSTGADLHPRA